MPTKQAFERKLLLEKAINTIDLYADHDIRAVAHQVVNKYSRGQGWVVYEPLLTKLRDRFRASIGLERLE